MDPYQEDRLKRFKVFDYHAAHLLGAIRLCLEGGYIVPAMMLTFAGIDVWLGRTEPMKAPTMVTILKNGPISL